MKISCAIFILISFGIVDFARGNCDWGMVQLSRGKMDDLFHDLQAEGRLTDLGPGEESVVDSPNAITTCAVTTCVAVAVINKKTRRVYLGHFQGQDVGDYSPLLKKAFSEAGNVSDLQVVLAGGEIGAARNESIFPLQKARAEEYAEALRREIAAAGVTPEQLTDKLRVVPYDGSNLGFDILVDPKNKRVYLVAPKTKK